MNHRLIHIHLTRTAILIVLLSLLAVSSTNAQDSVFPVTIEHKFGSTTVNEAPQRVVSIGFSEQDPLLALGVVPVAVRYWYGDESNAIFSWAQDEANGEVPVVLNMPFGNLNYEAILTLQPDLISAVDSGITQEEYDTLSQIAPTLAQSDEYFDFGTPWQETTRRLGSALGKSEEAEALVNRVESLFAEAREQNPHFEGQTIAVAYQYGEENTYGYYTAQDARGRFFSDLGFVVPDELNEIAGESYYAYISAERMDLLDQDLLVFLGLQFAEGGREAIENDPLVSQLNAVREGRVVFIPPEYDDALQFSSVLSLEYALEGIVPELQTALGGETAACEVGLRSFDHAMGTSCIPETPQRVVVLDTGELDNALALGAPIVGAPVADVLQYQAYLSEQLEGINDTGTISEPNFEAILALEPDLIIGSKQRYEAIYPQLSAIAPTVFTESLRVPWQDNFNFHAEALGRTTEAEQLLADYEAHVAEVQDALGDTFESTTISIIRFRPGQVRLYLKSSYIGYILQDVGLGRPPTQDEDVFSAEISIEEMQQVDADYIFVTGYDVEDSERETFLSSPLWQTLEAVQNGQVVDVNDDTWIAGLGVQAANLVLDDLEAMLAPESVAVTECEEGFRLFDHERLATDPVCIPENPQRIVSLDMPATEFLLLNDIPIVGVFVYAADEISAITPGLAEELEGIPTFDCPPNLELVTELNPDLIIAFKDSSLFYSGMDEIAPLVVYDAAYATDWKSSTSFWSEVFQREDVYEEMLATYDARVAELQAALGETRGEIEVSAFVPSATYPMIWLIDSAQGIILQDVGLGRPESQGTTFAEGGYVDGGADYGFVAISSERLDLADGDEIFIFTWPTTDPAVATENLQYLEDFHATDPLWQSLEGVQTGNVHIVGAHWFRAQTYLAAHLILDDLFTYLAKTESTIPSPAAEFLALSAG